MGHYTQGPQMTPAEAVSFLKGVPMTEKAIGAAVGASQSTINKICRGDMKPNWELGQALVRLAESMSGQEAA